MPKATLPKSDADILITAIAPDKSDFTTEAARGILKLGFTRGQRAEMGRLLDKNNAGNITKAELAALDRYVRVGNLLSILQAKARTTLAAKDREFRR